MRFFPLLLLGCAATVFAQQKPPTGDVTVPLKIFGAPKATQMLPPDTVVLEIGDTRITAAQLQALIEVYPMNQQIYAQGPGKQQFADTVVRMIVLAEEARKRKLDQTDTFKTQLQFSQDNLLAQTLATQLPQEVTVDDEKLHQYLDQHRCEFSTWKARQIVVRFKGSPLPIQPGEADLTEEEALAKAEGIRSRIAAGADFGELARENSDDPASASNGGDLGSIKHGQAMPSFEDALCALKPGELSQPVKLSVGYAIIQMESVQTKDFAELKPQLEMSYRKDYAQQYLKDLIAKTKVVRNPAYYAPPEAPASGDAKKP